MEGITPAFMKNMPVVITVKFDDGREGRIWTECDENSEVFIPNLSDEFKDCKFSIEIDNERWEELCKIKKPKPKNKNPASLWGKSEGKSFLHMDNLHSLLFEKPLMLKLKMTGKNFSPGILKLLHIRFVENGFKLWYNYVNVNSICIYPISATC